jgi:hypothetical protein
MAKITVDVSENGWITIDVTNEAARITGGTLYTGGRGEDMVEGIARAVSEDGGVERKWFRTKKGLNNSGFTAIYRDEARFRSFQRRAGQGRQG